MDVQLRELLADVDVLERSGDPGVEVTSVVHNDLIAGRGSCFCCIRGSRADGHDYAPRAVARGSVALVVERILPLDVSQARVADVRRAIGPIAARCYGQPSRAMRCLGVTGTNGKTTTTYLLDAIGRAAGDVTGVIGTTGARISDAPLDVAHTTPEASDLQEMLARMRDAGVGTVALEVSSHALAQHRVDATWFEAVCFTNLSPEHLDFHGSLDRYFEAKAALFEPARAAAGVVNIDDPYGGKLAHLASARGLGVTTYATHDPAADFGATDVELTRVGSRFMFVDRRRSGAAAVIDSSLVGEHNVMNALAAAATATVAGFPFDAIVAGLSSPLTIPGRLERVEGAQPFGVMVDYAHTPDALTHALRAARVVAGGSGRVIVVFGCGGDRDREKRPAMGSAATANADHVVVTSDNPRSEDPAVIADEIRPGLEGGAPFTVELDRRDAIRLALAGARPGDVVVIAGKGHETGQTFGDVSIPFDDAVVA
ncbi:MAG: UDP-N-acetylmuramoyl-L-alanyl-D-glutamate--2,6-diaminopimelate ligase, partial [Actinobacteria bacterium]|nr:UDP-N-acetylmuramoyl-L-alanyl-D-glutamate--2,6-diaminopimelate ligase [Actinomycetota bacterium]